MNGTVDSLGKSGASLTRRPFLVLFGLFLLVILLDLLNGVRLLADPDDIVRLIQIRELLNGHHWFDMSLSAIAMPETYISHYSRLVDLPYYLISLTLSPFMDRGEALDIAAQAWPLVLLAIFARLSVYVLERLYDRRLSILDLELVTPVAAIGVLEFTPGRIDHHNFLMVLMVLMLAGLFSPRPVGGLIAGAAMALSMSIGLEVLPNIVLALATLSIHAIIWPSLSARRLSWTGLGMALTAAPAAFASFGPIYGFRDYCDTFAAPWIACFAGGGLVLAIVPLSWRAVQSNLSGPKASALRLVLLAVPSLAVLVGVAVVYPQCLNGPYGSMDALTKSLWFDSIAQEKNVFEQPSAIVVPLALVAGAVVMALFSALPYVMHKIRERRADFLISIVLATGCILLFFAYLRTFNYASMFAMFLVPAGVELFWPLGRSGNENSTGRRKWKIAAVTIPAFIVMIIALSVTGDAIRPTAANVMNADTCSNADFSVLDAVPPGRIMAPLGLTTSIAEFHPQHTVEALALHRAAPGIHRMLVAFLSKDKTARDAALAPFDYLAVCARKYRVTNFDDALLYMKLVNRERVAGLVPIPGPVASDFRLFRIDHSALQ